MIIFLFYFFSALVIASALAVVLASRPTRALLSLIVTMFSLAVLYLLLGAPFVAMANIIVYAGAVLVLFLFVIMLQGVGARELPIKERFHGAFLGLTTFVAVAFVVTVLHLTSSFSFGGPLGIHGTVEVIGHILFTEYLLPFELTSILLLLGILAGVALAKKETSS